MRRALCVAAMSSVALLVAAPAALADPAVELPAAACNPGTALATAMSNANSNIPIPPHGIHGCHLHSPGINR